MPSINSQGARIKKTFSSRLSNKKVSLLFLFSFFIFPAFAQTEITSEEAVISNPNSDIYNSQTVLLLTPKIGPENKNATGGPADILIEGDALIANISPISDISSEKIFSSGEKSISIYTVRDGDTISTIAEMFEISPNTIRWANDIDIKGTIKPGQDLIILPIEGVKHKVAKGQTIESIAKQYQGDAREIRIFNGIEDGEILAQGTEIIIPNGELKEESPTKTTKPSSTTVKGTPSKETPSGYYIKPVKGIKTQGPHGRYRGIDVGAKVGTPVWAMADGTAIIVKSVTGWNGGYGGMVVISHSNGTQTLYAHLSRIDIKQGQKIKQGEVLGAVGNTGRSTGPHLHFEIRGASSAAAKLY